MKTNEGYLRSAKALRSRSGRTSPAVIAALAAAVRWVDRRGTPRGARSKGTLP